MRNPAYTARTVNDLAEMIREVDGDNTMPLPYFSATITNRLVALYGHDALFASEVVEFVERTNCDKQLGAGRLAELIVAEFELDEVA
ncbi:hypothetical protein AB0F72_08605 [Actinoplanes sp. NPDC023936]|uniref:hypothetical protein n=1 Tax=Actinoplanes sp. NPDC023936 TaxID=3154910 RepID=UPI0033C6A9C5